MIFASLLRKLVPPAPRRRLRRRPPSVEVLENRHLLDGTVNLEWATCLGGEDPFSKDRVTGIAVDQAGAVSLSGITDSADFPTTPEAYDRTHASVDDGFVARLSNSGNSLLWSTFLGSSVPWLSSVAVDLEGFVYVAGVTKSADGISTPGAYDQTFNGASDVVVAKIAADGTRLVWATYLGGSRVEMADLHIALDEVGDVYIAGQTYSPDFPTTPGAILEVSSSPMLSSKLFVAKLRADGAALLWSAHFVGYGAGGLAVDASGHVYLTGVFLEPSEREGVTVLHQTIKVKKLSPRGDTVEWSAGLPVGVHVSGIALALDDTLYLLGDRHESFARRGDLIATPGAFDALAEGSEALVAKLGGVSGDLLWLTNLGGNHSEWAGDIAVDRTGRVYVTGTTSSPDFPRTDGARIGPGGDRDAFLTVLSPAGDTALYSATIGGSNPDGGAKIVLDPSGDIYVSGWTQSPYFPVTPGAYDRTCDGRYGRVGWLTYDASDIFVMKLENHLLPISEDSPPEPLPDPGPRVIEVVPQGAMTGPRARLTLTFSESVDYTSFTTDDVALSGPAGPIPIRRIRHISDTTFRIRFPKQTLLGEYHLTLGPDVRDLAGNLMDQDQDGQSGEVTEDQFNASFHIVPRTFVFFFTGKDAPAEGSGMEKLRGAISGDPILSKLHVLAPVFGWPEGTRPKTQRLAAQAFVQSFLTSRNADRAQDRVVLVGHSYGGNIAYLISGDLDGRGPQTQAAHALITFEPINWRLCAFLPPAVDCNQSNNSRPLPKNVSGNHIINFLQRRFSLSPFYLRGFRVEGARNDDQAGQGPDGRWGTLLDPSPDDTTHTLIDNDWSPGPDGEPGFANVDDDRNGEIDDDQEAGFPGSDDAALGTHALTLDLLRELTAR